MAVPPEQPEPDETVAGDKGNARLFLKKIWEELPETALRQLSLDVRHTVKGSEEWEQAEDILGYLSFGSEIGLDSLLQDALDENKRVYVPVLTGRDMDFYRIEDLSGSSLRQNSLGIREPLKPADPFKGNRRSLMLVPGRGFTPAGGRLGRGGGYYDRYLARIPVFSMGICWEGILRDSLPLEDHDIPLDCLCCGGRILYPGTLLQY